MRNSLHSHTLIWYFGLTFLLSWALWLPMALDYYGLLPVPMNPLFVLLGRLLGTFGPALSAILISAITGGKPAVGSLLGQLRRRRVGWKWYVAACFVFPMLVFVVAGLYRLLPDSGPLPFQPVTVGNLIAVIIILTISVLGEEIGWRGFALPGLQRRYPALHSSLILGTIHTIWHLPFWIILGELESFGPGYWLISWAYISALSIYITWLMNNTDSSLLLAVLLHWTINIVTVGFLPITTLVPAYLIFAGITWGIAIGLIRIFGTGLRIRSNQLVLRMGQRKAGSFYCALTASLSFENPSNRSFHKWLHMGEQYPSLGDRLRLLYMMNTSGIIQVFHFCV